MFLKLLGFIRKKINFCCRFIGGRNKLNGTETYSTNDNLQISEVSAVMKLKKQKQLRPQSPSR